MTREDRRWERLQSLWVTGELLTSAQNVERLKLAAGSFRRQRELAVTRQLQQYLQGPELDTVESEFVESVLLKASDRRTPHLRLVSPNAPVAEPQSGAAKPSRRLKFWHGGLAVSALAAGGILWLQQISEPTSAREQPAVFQAVSPAAVTLARSELVFVSGEVTLNQGAVNLGERTLSGGEQLVTRNGRACLTVEPSINVCLGPQSSVVLESLSEQDVRVKVLEGHVVAALDKRRAGHHFALTDGNVTAAARGTIFALTKDVDRARTRVTVVEGRVEVSRQQRASTLVRAHSELVVDGQEHPKSKAISRSHEAQVLAMVAPRELWQRGELGILAIGTGLNGSEAMVGGEGPFALPVITFAPVGQQRVIVRDAQGRESLLDVEVRAGETRQVDASVQSAGEPAPKPPAEQKSPGELLGEARGALKKGDSRGALKAYRRLRTLYPNSPEASTVLVTVGKLELKQNSPVSALSAFDAYLSRGGPLQPEALAGKIRALRALGRSVAERAAIQQYLKQYPSGFEAVALKKRLEVLSGP